MTTSRTSFRLTRLSFPTLLGLALLGSGSGTITAAAPENNPAQVPAAWRQPAPTGALDPAALAQWWKRFNDPVLDQLIARALQASPDVRTAIAKVEQARATHGVQRAALLPSVSAAVSDQGTRTHVRTPASSVTSETATAAVDASWQLDLFGQQRAATRATAADLAQAEDNFRAAQVSLAAEVATDYVTLRATEAQLNAVNATLSSREENLQYAKWSQQAGTGSSLDTAEAVTALEQARASVPSLELTLTQTRNQLAVLCGRMPGSLDDLLGNTGRVPAPPATLSAGIPAETLRQRPDVSAAAHALEAATARTSAAKLSRYPTISLTGSLGVDALRAGKLLSPESTFASLLGSLSVPIFSSGKINQTIRLQTAVEQQALVAYESTVLTALSEVENALVAIQRQSERLAALDKATDAAAESYALARQRYQAGDVDFLTVLDAQRTLLTLQVSQIGTTSDQTAAHIQLYKALGGGWTNL